MGPLAAHLAAFEGMEKALIRIAADAPSMLSARNLEGETPAHHAAAAGKHGIIDILGRIDPKLLMMQDHDGQTPAHTASMYRHAEVLKAVGRRAPDSFELRDNGGLSPLDLAGDNADCREAILHFLKVAWPPSAHTPGTRRVAPLRPGAKSQSMVCIPLEAPASPKPRASLDVERATSAPVPPDAPLPPAAATALPPDTPQPSTTALSPNALSAASTPLLPEKPEDAPPRPTKNLSPLRLFSPSEHQPDGPNAEAVSAMDAVAPRRLSLVSVVLLCGLFGTLAFFAVVELGNSMSAHSVDLFFRVSMRWARLMFSLRAGSYLTQAVFNSFFTRKTSSLMPHRFSLPGAAAGIS